MGRLTMYEDPATKPPFEGGVYALTEEETEFFKSQTGIKDGEELKHHIITVQKKAYEIYAYPCIRLFSFTKLRMSQFPAYESALQLQHSRENAILLDLGCCFGNDTRKAVADGWPVENVIASDLRQGFWDFGHELFRSTPETFPAAFVEGDVFNNSMIAPRKPFTEIPDTPPPALRTLTSLTPLQGRVSAIHVSQLFHLFDEEQQAELAHRIGTLLDPRPGSVIFGVHAGLPQKGTWDAISVPPTFCHSPESWRMLWDGEVFPKGTVRVESFLQQWDEINGPNWEEFRFIVWSVTRL